MIEIDYATDEAKTKATSIIKQHVVKVRELTNVVIASLQQRAESHDRTKLQEPEFSVFARCIDRLRQCKYGSEAHKLGMVELAPALRHHYRCNRHHPEHWRDGVAGMSLIDLIEMINDWIVAAEYQQDGSIWQSMAINTERFKIDDQLKSILENTISDILQLRDVHSSTIETGGTS